MLAALSGLGLGQMLSNRYNDGSVECEFGAVVMKCVSAKAVWQNKRKKYIYMCRLLNGVDFLN